MDALGWLSALVIPADVVSWLKGLVPGVGAVAGLLRWRDKRRERRQAEAAGSHLTVKDGISHDWHRWCGLHLTSWTGTPLRLISVKIVWPPTACGTLLLEDEQAGALMYGSTADGRLLRPTRDVQIEASGRRYLTLPIKVSGLMRRLPLWASRLKLRVTVETIDAQRRTIRLALRSQQVDWSKPPQE